MGRGLKGMGRKWVVGQFEFPERADSGLSALVQKTKEGDIGSQLGSWLLSVLLKKALSQPDKSVLNLVHCRIHDIMHMTMIRL